MIESNRFAERQPMHFPEPRAVYIHVPFCEHRCGYCDFTVIAGRDDLADAYLDALANEMASLKTRRVVDTIFVGGGTPTHLSPKQLERLIRLIADWFTLARAGEFSIEANPDGLTSEKVRVLADGGVNRISLGVQSFDSGVLRVLERVHTERDIEQAVAAVKSRIENVALDLIFGVPGQTIEVWKSTLEKALQRGPRHISTYGLTFEKGTTFWSRRQKGSLSQMDDQIEREMYTLAMDRLAAGGFEHYEISNFAKPDHRCRHNETYWKALPYFGFGPGAARYLAGRRETNHRSVFTWLKRIAAGQSPVADFEELSGEDRARESIMLGLRTTAGIERGEFKLRHGFELDALIGQVLRERVAAGHMIDDGKRVRLTREGRFFSDSIVVEVL
jgi:oxygen-independent coproporphyrinogen-3 oxidase